MFKAATAVLVTAVMAVGCSSPRSQDNQTAAQAAKASPSSRADVQAVNVVVKGGRLVKDPGRVKVPLGRHVALTVTTDVADELHLHGYDLEKETVPGKPATIEFDASIPGEFEAELHHTHLTVVEFEVR